jgi:hypothetical protein
MNWDPDFRIRWLIRLIGIGILAGVALSWKLWITDRFYPLFPVWDWIPQLPGPVSKLFAFTFVGFVIWLVIKPSRANIISVLVFMLILALQDQSRWQPWFYQYGLMLFPFAFLRKPDEDASILGIQQFIVIMVYIWGGIHKCQPGWMSVWENSLLEPILKGMETGTLTTFLIGCGYGVPVIEMLMGIGLFFRRTWLPSIIVVWMTHVVILVLLGPVKGYISNSVVWPWNLVMMAMVLVLFYKSEKMSFTAIRKKKLLLPFYEVMALMLIAPILFYAGLWDRYLSFSLYAGHQKRYLVRMPASSLEYFPPELANYLIDPRAADGHLVLSPSTWSTEELNVPLISEWRILRSFSRKLCTENQSEDPLMFYVDHRHLPKKPKEYFACDQIAEMGREVTTKGPKFSWRPPTN